MTRFTQQLLRPFATRRRRTPRTHEQLIQVADRRHLEYVFFWHVEPGEEVGPGSLSQWEDRHPFTIDGVSYRTAEHWMMASKARMLGDRVIAARVVGTDHPKKAKALGRQVSGFDPTAWDEASPGIVLQGSHAKFSQHPDLADYLLSTGNRILVEASPHDKVWGIGMEADDPRAVHPIMWDGPNLLGFTLMQVRDKLAA